MKWNFKGKYYGVDVNSLPEDYLEWVIGNAKNGDMRRTAEKVLEFRKKGDSPSVNKAKSTFKGEDNPLIRGLCLLIATNMDNEDPFRALPMAVKYVVFNEIPMKDIAEAQDLDNLPNLDDGSNPLLEGLV